MNHKIPAFLEAPLRWSQRHPDHPAGPVDEMSDEEVLTLLENMKQESMG